MKAAQELADWWGLELRLQQGLDLTVFRYSDNGALGFCSNWIRSEFNQDCWKKLHMFDLAFLMSCYHNFTIVPSKEQSAATKWNLLRYKQYEEQLAKTRKANKEQEEAVTAGTEVGWGDRSL